MVADHVVVMDWDQHDTDGLRSVTIPVTIGSGVCAEGRIVIMNGGKISDGAITAAGSLVKKKMPSSVLVAGVPVQSIRNAICA